MCSSLDHSALFNGALNLASIQVLASLLGVKKCLVVKGLHPVPGGDHAEYAYDSQNLTLSSEDRINCNPLTRCRGPRHDHRSTEPKSNYPPPIPKIDKRLLLLLF